MEIQTKKFEHDNIIYLLNEEEKTAGVLGCQPNIRQIIIPRSINYESKEYEITSILENSFNNLKIQDVQFASDSNLQTIEKYSFSKSNIKRIKIPSSVTFIGENAFRLCQDLKKFEIPNDSKLQTIEKCAFAYSSIESIKVPSNLVDLKEGWCNFTLDLREIEVSSENPRYCFYEDKMIIGKKNIDQSNYDSIVFCVRDIENIKIPNFIEHICSGSFNFCKKLQQVEIPTDSKLLTIGEFAFSRTKIKNFIIPSSVTSIGENAFYYCSELERIEIPNDSKLQVIDKNALSYTSIESINIPSSIVDLKEGWCNNIVKITKINVSPTNARYCCYEDKMIIGKSNINQSNYDSIVFCVRDIKSIKIPNFIEHICTCSFDLCQKLQQIQFSHDTRLKTIDKFAFSFSGINNITIPSSVTFIGKSAFHLCSKLKRIEFQNDSKLQTIESEAISYVGIKCIAIPSSVTLIKENALSDCGKLLIIEINNNEPLSMYQAAFNKCQNVLLMIPVHS